METTKFKVGDKIIVTDDYADDYADEFTKGKVYTVKAVGGHGYDVEGDGGGSSYVSYESALPAPKPKRKAPAKKPKAVAVPEGKIGKDEIIGQDNNKKILKIGIDKDLPVLLVGETGTGKTTIIREQAQEIGRDLVRFSITGETTVDEFVGKYELEAGKTVWRDGVLLDAMKKGKWLVADEINVALPEILFVLHSLLDDDKYVTVSQHNGEVVKPHKDFRFFATMNPTDEYAGTKELNKAFQSRFSIILQLHYPDPATEAKIISDKSGVDMDMATKMADVAAALRKAKKDEKIFYTCSTRDLLHWAGLCDVLDPGDAFKVAILNKAPTEAEPIAEIYKHIIGRYVVLEQPSVTLTVEWFEGEAKKIIADRKQFEADKEKVRQEITQEIIHKLTGAGGKVETPKEADPVNVELADIFN